MRFRMGGGWKHHRPHRAVAFGLIALGLLVMLFAMPLFVYVAIFGGLIAYVGYTLHRR